MPRFPAKYSADQKAAIVHAICDRKLKPGEAVAAAQRGELPDLEPFTMPASTAADLATKERRRRRGLDLPEVARGSFDDARTSLLRRFIAVQHSDLERIENDRRRGRYDERRFRLVMQNQRELDSLLKAAGSGRPASPNGDTAPGDEKPPNLIEQLAAKDRRSGRRTDKRPPSPPTSTDSEAPDTEQAAEQETGTKADGVIAPATDRQGVSPSSE